MTTSSPRTTAALRRLVTEAVGAHEAVATSLGMNPTDLRCLELLAREPEATPSRLAELLGLTTGAVTGILDRLERTGFVRREADPADRRRVFVRPEPARMAEIDRRWDSFAGRLHDPGAGLRDELEGLAEVLAGESDRLRVTIEGGMLDGVYVAPVGAVEHARLLLVTGAPRLSLGGVALGQQVRMVAETAATRLRLRAGDTGPELVRATFVGPPPQVRSADGSVTMRYRRRMIDTRAREIEATLTPAVPWRIEIDGGITDFEADLRGVPVDGVTIRGGANHLRLELPRPHGTVRVSLAGGTSQARVSRPRDVPVALAVRGGAANLRFDGDAHQASGTDLRLESDRFGSVPDRYEIEVAGGAAQLTVTTD
jgi:DNA-binding MarR family transcriptional regulator